MLLPALPIGFGLVAVTALAAVAARRTGAPPSIFLVLVGLGLGFSPVYRASTCVPIWS
jgi:hypothetical protein